MSGTPNVGQAQPSGPDPQDPYQFDKHGRPTLMYFPGDVKKAYDYRHRPRGAPGVTPANDPTIDIIAAQADGCVADLMQAFFDVSACLDNSHEGVIRFCTRGHPRAFAAKDVEAACRIIHASLLRRCRIGFCGHPSQDLLFESQAGRPRNFEVEDKTCNCQTRFDTIVKVLRHWKSACSAVVTSTDYIEKLVNSPATVYKAKLVQIKGNNKRRSKVAEAFGTASKKDAKAQGAKSEVSSKNAPQQKMALVQAKPSYFQPPYQQFQPHVASAMRGDGNFSHGGHNYSHNTFHSYLGTSGGQTDPNFLSPFGHPSAGISPQMSINPAFNNSADVTYGGAGFNMGQPTPGVAQYVETQYLGQPDIPGTAGASRPSHNQVDRIEPYQGPGWPTYYNREAELEPMGHGNYAAFEATGGATSYSGNFDHALLEPPNPMPGSKRSRQQSVETGEYPYARRQKRDGDVANQEEFQDHNDQDETGGGDAVDHSNAYGGLDPALWANSSDEDPNQDVEG